MTNLETVVCAYDPWLQDKPGEVTHEVLTVAYIQHRIPTGWVFVTKCRRVVAEDKVILECLACSHKPEPTCMVCWLVWLCETLNQDARRSGTLPVCWEWLLFALQQVPPGTALYLWRF